MKTIPLSAAIALLTQALDVAVEGQSQTIVFQIGEAGEPFLRLETEEDFSELAYTFEDEHNQEVAVDGEWMTLIASPDHPDNPELTPVRMRLLRVMDLEDVRPGRIDMPPEVRKALDHVRTFHPEVDRVVYWDDGRWAYMTDRHEVPKFDDRVDVSILEDAGGAVDNLSPCEPIAFQLPEEE